MTNSLPLGYNGAKTASTICVASFNPRWRRNGDKVMREINEIARRRPDSGRNVEPVETAYSCIVIVAALKVSFKYSFSNTS